MTHDFVLIGGGIVGLATGMRLLERFPGKSMLLLEKEPGIWAPGTGIVNFAKSAQKYVEKIQEGVGELRFNARVERISSKNGVHVVQTTADDFEARFLINCAGLYSDHVARMDGAEPSAKIIPFRGEYYELKADKRDLVKGLIYPVPNPEFP